MPPSSAPKVLIFDIGGVCVVSPFQAILDYEKSHDIPVGYINSAISFSKPNGSWQKLERGEVPLDAAWFAAWKNDVLNPAAWKAFHSKNSRQISSPENQGPLQRLPPLPTDLDAADLYWTMMAVSRHPDPFMAPALRKLKQTGAYRLAALSNTSIFPPDHPYTVRGEDDITRVFDVFVSSAHVGMRKPDREIYEYTLQAVRRRWPEAGIEAADVVFFDDIGENLKTAREVGWRTVKVGLGGTQEAVRELERITGEKLLEGAGRAKL